MSRSPSTRSRANVAQVDFGYAGKLGEHVPPIEAGDRTMLPRIDDSRWPIVRIAYGDVITFEEISELSGSLQRIFETKGALAMVVDIGAVKATALTALHRKRLAEESDRLAAMGAFLAEAVIVPNPILRAVFAGYTWACKPKGYPSRAFNDFAAAFSWAREQIESASRAPALRREP